ncbi:MAG: RNA methyltransferase [Alcanivoracaceae bacterium]|nr:RNA methyltransferase [Alcanivoracaceae bacterium]
MGSGKSIVALSNPKSPTNVGAVMRAAGCFGVSEVRYNGVRFDRAMRYATDTHFAADIIPLVRAENLVSELPSEIKIVCIELAEGATSLVEFEHPAHALYLFGPEDGTLSQQEIDSADAVVFVPTTGCLNLAATVNVVLYDRLAKSGEKIDDDALITQSRDTNNRVKVRSQ